jgi:hypothetical protein
MDVTEEEWYNVSNIPNTEYCIEETCCGLLHNSYILHYYHITQSMLYINFTELYTMKLMSGMCFNLKYWRHQVPFIPSAYCYINITALHAEITYLKNP